MRWSTGPFPAAPRLAAEISLSEALTKIKHMLEKVGGSGSVPRRWTARKFEMNE